LLESEHVLKDTLIKYIGDNGPDLGNSQSGGNLGLFTGRASGYWSTGKGSTWEGGVRQSAFAFWQGKIKPQTRSPEIV